MDHHHQKSYPLIPSEYCLLDEIGHGVSATVYEAKCLALDETVAIKSIDLERLNATLDDVRREAQMMSLIDHPNVLRAHCSFIVQQNLWVVMPYMAGGSCQSIMKTSCPNGFEEPVIALILKETLKALEYLHQQGHLHRDVKAGNILIDSRGGVKVGDFGVSACVFDSRDGQRLKRNTFVGTPCWMAPEVIDRGNGYDHKADIWSFGITALELAHGHAPFSKLPPIKALLMQLQGAPPGLDYETDKKFSRSFREMVGLCLVKDPARRPSAEKLLKHSFFRNTKNPDYIVKHVLDNLPSLVERVRAIRAKESLRVQEEEEDEDGHIGMHHVKMRRISGWNFNEDNLKFEPMYPMDENARLCCIEIGDSGFKTREGRENLNPNAQVNTVTNSITEVKDTQLDSESNCIPEPKNTQIDSERNCVLKPKNTQVASEANCIPEPENTQVVSETNCVLDPKNTKVDSQSNCVPGPKNSQVASEAYCMPEPGSIIESGHKPHSDAESNTMPDTGSSKLCSGDADRGEDHQGLDVAQGLWHCEAADPNPIFCPVYEENAGLKSSSDSEAMGGDMRALPESKECGHLENQNPKEISPKNQRANPEAVSEQWQRRENQGLLHADEKRHPRGISDKKDCKHSEGSSEKSQPTTDKPANGTEHNSKGQGGHGLKPTVVQKKGRFSVTEEDGAIANKPVVHPLPPLRRIHSLSSQTSLSSMLQGGLLSPTTQSSPHRLLHDFNSHSIPIPSLLPLLHSLLQSTNMQHDMLLQLLNTIGGDHICSTVSSPSSQANSMAMRHKTAWERESELVQQISNLQGKLSTLSDEVHIIKGKNAHLEHELNAIYYKGEEERIRKEETEQSEN
jgi:serine/threonine-protein kinase OSR1/STK39